MNRKNFPFFCLFKIKCLKCNYPSPTHPKKNYSPFTQSPLIWNAKSKYESRLCQIGQKSYGNFWDKTYQTSLFFPGGRYAIVLSIASTFFLPSMDLFQDFTTETWRSLENNDIEGDRFNIYSKLESLLNK